MYNNSTVIGNLPDFNNVKRVNQGYDNVYGAQHNTNHPIWETGGDYAAVARQSFTTPGMAQRYKGVNQSNLHWLITKNTGNYGMTTLRGEDDFSRTSNPYQAAVRLQKQIQLSSRDVTDDARGGWVMFFAITMMLLFVYYFI